MRIPSSPPPHPHPWWMTLRIEGLLLTTTSRSFLYPPLTFGIPSSPHFCRHRSSGGVFVETKKSRVAFVNLGTLKTKQKWTPEEGKQKKVGNILFRFLILLLGFQSWLFFGFWNFNR